MTQLAIVFETTESKVDAAVDLVGVTFLLERLNHVDHLGDMSGSGWIGRGTANTQCIQILKKSRGVALRHDLKGFTVLAAGPDEFVLHIREVHDVVHFKAAERKIATQQIFKHVGAKIPDMGMIVYRWTTGIESDFPRLDWLEQHFFP